MPSSVMARGPRAAADCPPFAARADPARAALRAQPVVEPARHLLERTSLQCLDQRVDVRLEGALVEVEAIERAQPRKIARQRGAGRGRLADQHRHHAQPACQCAGQLVAHVVVAVQPALQHVVPFRTDHCHHHVGGIELTIDQRGEVVAVVDVVDVVDVHEDIVGAETCCQFVVDQPRMDEAVVASIADEDLHGRGAGARRGPGARNSPAPIARKGLVAGGSAPSLPLR